MNFLEILYTKPLLLYNSNNNVRSRSSLYIKTVNTSNRTNVSMIVGGRANSIGGLKRIVTFLNNDQNFKNENRIVVVNGRVADLTNVFKIISNILELNTYGANSEVKYISPIYDTYTKFIDNIPVVNMSLNSFLLFEFTLDDLWLKVYNLFVFAPYIYSYNGTTIFGSVDNSIFITPSQISSSDNKIKICCTSSKVIASYYSKLNYMISKIPYDYILNSTYNILIRFASIIGSSYTLQINKYIKTTYNIDKSLNTTNLSNFYSSAEIIQTYTPVYNAISNDSTQTIINSYTQIKTYLNEIFSTIYTVYPYLSNYTDPSVNYAIDSFYVSIDLPIPINIQANNTCENYYTSNSINIENDVSQYIYILYLNQYSSGAGITSNIQIYNSTTHNEIENGSIISGPDIPTMSTNNYPYPTSNDLPVYGIYGLSMAAVYAETDGDNIDIAERICYGLTNFNYVYYDSVNTSIIYVGEKLTDAQVNYLYDNFQITVTYAV